MKNAHLNKIKNVAIGSSVLSVVYTVLLAARVLGGDKIFCVETLLAVGLALCFEGAKYTFLFSGWGIIRENRGLNGSAVLRHAGGTMMTVSVVIAMLSVAASQHYIEAKGLDAQDTTAQEQEMEIKHAQAESPTVRGYTEAIVVIDDKVKLLKGRMHDLLSQKNQLVDSDMFTRAQTVDTLITGVSREIDDMLDKKEELMTKRDSESIKIRDEIKSKQTVEAVTVGPNATVIIAILLEVISLLAVVTVSVMTNGISTLGKSVEPVTLVDAVKEAPSRPRRRKRTDPVPVEVADFVPVTQKTMPGQLRLDALLH